jgi:acyl-CoA thioesterase-1
MRMRRLGFLLLAMAATCVLSACQAAGGGGSANPAPVGRQDMDPIQAMEASKKVIVVLGDSITAGLGLTTSQAYPARLQDMFAAEGYAEVEVVNAGVSGDTTAGGLRRVESVLAPNVRVGVVALGGNDALRGLSTAQTRENLEAIVTQFEAVGVPIVLAGMEAPTNLGDDYRQNFRAAFAEVAAGHRRSVAFVPFLLEGVGGMPQFNQADGIHPNEQGQKMIAELLYPKLRDLIDSIPDFTR